MHQNCEIYALGRSPEKPNDDLMNIGTTIIFIIPDAISPNHFTLPE